MAIYVPRARRRRNMILLAVAGVVVGLAVGVVFGRASAPTVEGRVASVRNQARDIAAQLHVVSFHITSGAASETAGGSAGADLALSRTEADLRRLLGRAPWVPAKTAGDLLADTVALRTEARSDAATPAFGRKVDALAGRIEATFGAAAPASSGSG